MQGEVWESRVQQDQIQKRGPYPERLKLSRAGSSTTWGRYIPNKLHWAEVRGELKIASYGRGGKELRKRKKKNASSFTAHI